MSNTHKTTKELSPLKRAFLKIEEMEARLAAAEAAKREPIAIVGLGCRLPNGIHTPEAFWQLLREGVDAVKEFPRDRWDVEAYYDPDPNAPGKMSTKWGAFLDEVDHFDPHFFGISPREAASMDPQQRLLLEVVWEALEAAGEAPDKLLNTRTGVFLAMCKIDYAQLMLKQNNPALLDTYYASGNAYSTAAGRISYVLGLQGPCLTVDTACSSSLVAVHLACQSLRNGESNMAIAGGVNLVLSPDNTITFSKANMLAADGRCKTFDAAADGFVQGEGCGVIVLKRLSDARANGDCILALIRGSAINQDGASSGLTAPNGPAQEAVIREALANAGVQPHEVSYIETHGTGTSLGDPIEVQAIGAALGTGRAKETSVLLGALKTNLGHLEGAAGIAGLIKAVLALQHQQIPPTLHFQNPNSFIPWKDLPVEVVTQLRPWPAYHGKRLAGVSAFGFSGTNAHVVLEEGSDQWSVVSGQFKEEDETKSEVNRQAERLRHLLTLSAKSEAALKELTKRYEKHVREHEGETLADLCYSANTGRAQLPHRLAMVANTTQELQEKLSACANGETPAHVARGFVVQEDQPKIAFLFTGQGAQYIDMGRRLYETQPVFRAALDRCEELLRPHLEAPLLSVLFSNQSSVNSSQWSVDSDQSLRNTVHRSLTTDHWPRTTDPLLHQTAYTQPALFAVEYALAQLWQSWGIMPSIVMGHSVGEYVAACVAGVFGLEDALTLIATRGRLMQALPQNGAMAAIFASEEKVAAALARFRKSVAIAAMNGPENVVISGESEVVRELCARFEAEGIKHKALAVSHAFHSPLMEPMLDEFEKAAGAITHAPPRLGFVSNLTGKPCDFRFAQNDSQSTIHNPQSYWRAHAREAVQFAASVQTLHEKGVRLFLEIGPHPALLGMASKCLPGEDCVWAPSLRKGKDDEQQMLDSLAALYVNGVNPDWRGFDREYPRRKIALPTYPFQRKRYWFDDERRVSHEERDLKSEDRMHATRSSILDSQSSSPLHGSRLRTPLLREIIFEAQLDVASTPLLAEHRVHEKLVLPTTAYLEMILAAAAQAFGEGTHAIEDMDIRAALILQEDETRTMQLVFSPESETRHDFQIISFSSAERNGDINFTTHASGKVRLVKSDEEREQSDTSLAQLRAQCQEEISLDDFYAQLRANGLQFGPRFHGIAALWREAHHALGRIRMNEAIAPEARQYRMHPALLDACLQVVGAIMSEDRSSIAPSDIFMPVAVQSFRLLAQPDAELWSHASLRETASTNQDVRTLDFYIYSSEGEKVAELRGLQVKRVALEKLQTSATKKFQDWFYEVQWQPQALAVATLEHEENLPSCHELAESLPGHLHELSAANNFQIYDQLLPRLDELSFAYILQCFAQLGWDFSFGRRFTLMQMAEALHVSKRHHRLLRRVLEILQEEGCLVRDGENWEVWQLPRAVSAETLAQKFSEDFPEHLAEFELLQRGGQNLAAVLQDKFDPLQVLFPGGSFTLAEKLYDESPGAKVYNGLVRKLVQQLVARLPQERTLRVLEVGAGTGGTTSFVLQDFPAARTDYVFTDLSPLFLARAQEKFKQYPCVRYELLDIEQSPAAQGFTPHHYDVVICANVVHATKDLHETLAHLKQLLAPKGMLILLEGVTPHRWIDLTFGMTEGWWRFTDAELRETYPLITQTQWQTLLESEGFTQFVAVPQDLSGGRALSQNAMLLARAPRAAEDGNEKGAWLLLCDESGFAQQLAERLHARGDEVIRVANAEAFTVFAENHYGLRATSADDYKRLLHETFIAPKRNCLGVIDLRPSDDAPSSEYEFEQLCAAQDRGARSVLALVQTMLSSAVLQRSKLWLVTRGAQPVGEASSPVALVQSPLWGMGRALMLEHPELHCVRVDLGPYDDLGNLQLLHQELFANDAEDQVAYRSGVRYVARLKNVDSESVRVDRKSETTIPETAPLQLEIAEHGTLDGLALRTSQRRALHPSEIEIRVRATGLNFRDVLNVLGMRGDDDPLGGEVAGVVVRVGERVSDFKIGDEVVAVTVGGFSTYVTTSTELVVHKPATLRFEEAATIPLAFLTAHYALHVLGKIKAGERVLIHAAAGGVGMAAVQLAQRAGAEVFATAGSAEKRAFLKSLGVEHVYDSRTLAFAEEIVRLENRDAKKEDGESRIDAGDSRSTIFDPQSSKLDLVLNSLTGAFIPQSLRLLREGGRFLEIGKKEILSREQVAAINAEAAYFAVDLAEKIKADPLAIRPLFVELMNAIARGELKPLPHKIFSLQEASAAFRYMAQAKHIGKVVVVQEIEDGGSKMVDRENISLDLQSSIHDLRSTNNDPRAFTIKSDATYLITGGLSGIGLLTAQWLVERGARHLVLMGRRAASEETQRAIAAMEEHGAQVFAVQGDVSNAEDVTRVLAEINQAMPLLRGIIHSAGVLDDGVLLQQTWERFAKVMAPKVYGAWHLHAMTKHMPLDFFVLYSSVSALLGSPGQTNHSAANAFLDALAHHRRASGLPAMSINWGAWSEVGAAARHNVGDRVSVRGISTFTPQQGLQVLGALFEHPFTQVGVMPVDWMTFANMFGDKRMPRYFSALVEPAPQRARQMPQAPQAKSNLLQQLQAATTAKRYDLVLQHVETQARKVLSMDAAQAIHEKQPLTELGLDSLMAVELRNLLGAELNLPRALPATLVFDYPTTAALTHYLTKELFGEEQTSSRSEIPEGKTDGASVLDKIEELSEEEIDRLFAERVGGSS